MRLREKIIAVVACLPLLLGLGMSSASAYTVYYDRYYYGPSNGTFQNKYCYRDYNWWEETFHRSKDGYYLCGLRYVR